MLHPPIVGRRPRSAALVHAAYIACAQRSMSGTWYHASTPPGHQAKASVGTLWRQPVPGRQHPGGEVHPPGEGQSLATPWFVSLIASWAASPNRLWPAG